jgi:hypothetical protein
MLNCANNQGQKEIKYKVDDVDTLSDIKASVALNNIHAKNQIQEEIRVLKSYRENPQSNVNMNDIWLNLSESSLLRRRVDQISFELNNFVKKYFEGKYDRVLALNNNEIKEVLVTSFDSFGFITRFKNKEDFSRNFDNDEEYAKKIVKKCKIYLSIAEQVWSQYNKDPKIVSVEKDAQKEFNSILTNTYQKFGDEFIDFLCEEFQNQS